MTPYYEPLPGKLYKLCTYYCDPTGNGTRENCNGDSLFNEILGEFDQGNNLTCLACSHTSDTNDISCIDGSTGMSQECPKHANAACFSAAVWLDNDVEHQAQSSRSRTDAVLFRSKGKIIREIYGTEYRRHIFGGRKSRLV